MTFSENSTHAPATSLVWTIAVALLVVLILYFGFKGLTGPLSSIPGPLIARWTDLPVRLRLLSGSKAQYVHSLHQKYGPIVRLGAKSIDISDPSAARELHGARSDFIKDPDFYTGGRVFSLFSTTDQSFHARRRRLLGPCFAEASMGSLEPAVLERAKLAITKIAGEIEATGQADLLKWWTLFAMDVISELCFGEPFRMLELEKKNQYATDIAQLGSFLPLRGAFPWLVWLAGYMPFLPLFANVAHARERIAVYSSQRTAKYLRLVESDLGDAQKRTLFGSLIQKSQLSAPPGGDANLHELSAQDITAESQSYITAGTDTTAVTLTYLVYSVCSHPQVRQRLLSELKALPLDLTHRDLRDLQYLNHVIDETLRLYGAAQGGLPRVAPQKGATLLGKYIPGGVKVSTQAYTIHRNGAIFSDPERFDPSRWESLTTEAKDAFMPFGVGPRNCIGLNLARMELRLCAALFFRAFPTVELSETADDDMELVANFLTMPKGHRCFIKIR